MLHKYQVVAYYSCTKCSSTGSVVKNVKIKKNYVMNSAQSNVTFTSEACCTQIKYNVLRSKTLSSVTRDGSGGI